MSHGVVKISVEIPGTASAAEEQPFLQGPQDPIPWEDKLEDKRASGEPSVEVQPVIVTSRWVTGREVP